MVIPHSPRFTFASKVAAALLLVLLAQVLLYGHEPGWTLGGFALGWCAVLAIAIPALRRGVPAMTLAIAAALALILVDDPNPLGWLLFCVAGASAVLLPRHRFANALTWSAQLASFALLGLVATLRDALTLSRLRRGGSVGLAVRLIALPLVGGALFLTLFAVANPVLGQLFAHVTPPSFGDVILHLLFWGAVLVLVWPSLRPRAMRVLDHPLSSGQPLDLPVATLVLSLAVFNAVFAVQNALDLVFLWSGASLPAGVTLAAYAHQGAYTLIATALIAGAFVLVALAPGSRAAQSPTVRALLLLWIAQNVLLVASSALRLLDYIDAYSLTVLRIAALAWIALVAVGLVLIGWRLLAGRTAAWLINANALAAMLVLIVADGVDLGAVAARWNVDRARRADQLDLCYLHRLGASALLPLIDLERRAAGPVLRDRARYLRSEAQSALRETQGDWHSWTWRGARRLAAADALVGHDVASPRVAPDGRACDGTVVITSVTSSPAGLTGSAAQ